ICPGLSPLWPQGRPLSSRPAPLSSAPRHDRVSGRQGLVGRPQRRRVGWFAFPPPAASPAVAAARCAMKVTSVTAVLPEDAMVPDEDPVLLYLPGNTTSVTSDTTALPLCYTGRG